MSVSIDVTQSGLYAIRTEKDEDGNIVRQDLLVAVGDLWMFKHQIQ